MITSSYARAASQIIRQRGKQVVVERRASGTVQPVTRQTLWAIPQPNNAALAQLIASGADNAANSQPHVFVFEASADVRETVDRIIYDGWYYTIDRCVPTEISGLVVKQNASGSRDGKVSA